MKVSFPQNYKVELSANGDGTGALNSVEAPPIKVGPPPQFLGSPEHWSPEDLFLAAINSCLMTTYVSLAKKKELTIKTYETSISGTLNKTKEGIVFTEIEVTGSIITDQPELAEQLLNQAHKYCIVSNAIKVKQTLAINFE